MMSKKTEFITDAACIQILKYILEHNNAVTSSHD